MFTLSPLAEVAERWFNVRWCQQATLQAWFEMKEAANEAALFVRLGV
jgi:hypothetical protein